MHKIPSEREQIKDVAARWAEQYYDASETMWPDKHNIKIKLLSLDTETATSEDVKEIIGNYSWVSPYKCSECACISYDIVCLGEPEDYDSNTAWICKDCLVKALELI